MNTSKKGLLFPNKKYKIIYADPPWDYYSAWYRKGSDSAGIWGLAQNHYKTMKLEDVKKLPIQKISADNCFLFLWATFPQLKEALEVIGAWGFEYKTVAFTWVKKNNDGSNFTGMGWYTRANAEICLLAKKGKPKVINHAVRQIVETQRRRHSAKPEEVRERIIQLCGKLPRIELFARQRVKGWDCWGNQISKH